LTRLRALQGKSVWVRLDWFGIFAAVLSLVLGYFFSKQFNAFFFVTGYARRRQFRTERQSSTEATTFLMRRPGRDVINMCPGQAAPGGTKWYRTPFRSELLEFVEGGFQLVARTAEGEDTVTPHPGVEDLVGPAVRVRMPWAANPVPRRSSVGRRAGHV
jgi:hypothetical protein